MFWFLRIDLFRVYWPIFPVLALKPTGPSEATWTLCCNNIKSVILGLDFCPFNCRVSHRCHRNVKTHNTTWGRRDSIAFGFSERESLNSFSNVCVCAHVAFSHLKLHFKNQFVKWFSYRPATCSCRVALMQPLVSWAEECFWCSIIMSRPDLLLLSCLQTVCFCWRACFCWGVF